MARRFLTDIDLVSSFALLNARLHPVSANPTGLGVGNAGQVWFNTTTGRFMVWNGTAAVDMLLRSNHEGTQLASTISDLATAVQAYRLDEFEPPNVALDFNNQRGINLGAPTGANDASTKSYVDNLLDGLASGQVLKGTVRVAATGNVSLTSPGTSIDGVTLAANDVVLLTGQTTASANGPYVWTASGSALVRTDNWNTSTEAVLGSYWIVREGSNADTFALLTNDAAITLDTTALTFTFRGAAGASYTAGDGLLLAGTEFDVGAGAGIVVTADAVAIDGARVARKWVGAVPTASGTVDTLPITVSGSSVTFNHATGNVAPSVTIRYGSAGTTPGQLVEVDDGAGDANNVTVTLPAAPAANEYVFGLYA